MVFSWGHVFQKSHPRSERLQVCSRLAALSVTDVHPTPHVEPGGKIQKDNPTKHGMHSTYFWGS